MADETFATVAIDYVSVMDHLANGKKQSQQAAKNNEVAPPHKSISQRVVTNQQQVKTKHGHSINML